MPEVKMDAEMKAFAADVLESIAQAKRGEFARVTTRELQAKITPRIRVFQSV